ncbi:hypothetical protein JCM10213v2_000986 [Rhodosporidiobolus nylandii]
MSLETGSITVTWEIKGVQALPEEKEGVSPKFDNERWSMVLKVGEKEGWCSFFIYAVFEEDEKDEAGNARREQEYDFEIELVDRSGKVLHSRQGASPGFRFDVLLSCVAPVSADLRKAYEGFFDSEVASDVCFSFASEASNGRHRVIWANKAFLSSRLEYFRTMFAGGFAEGAAAAARTDDGDERPAKRLKREHAVSPQPGDTPALDSSATHGQNAPLWDDDDDTLEWLPKEWLEANGPKEVEADEGGAAEPAATSDGKHLVKIVDAGFTTYRAMLFYLYSDKITFAPSASNFVVELLRKKANPPLDGDAATEEADDLVSRRAFLLAEADETQAPVESASAHTVYRLADKLDIPELKKLAFEAIEKGFTNETLVSALSVDFDEIQDAALKFALDHWNEVKASTAFDRVVKGSCAQEVEGAGEIWARLLSKLSV